MSKYLSEITFINAEEITTHKLLLPFKYAKIFCNLISPKSKKTFEEYFESDIEFQEIIYEFFGDIDDDSFEDEVDFLKQNGKSCHFMEILDYFLDDGVKNKNNCKIPQLILKDLQGKEPDFIIMM